MNKRKERGGSSHAASELNNKGKNSPKLKKEQHPNLGTGTDRKSSKNLPKVILTGHGELMWEKKSVRSQSVSKKKRKRGDKPSNKGSAGWGEHSA